MKKPNDELESLKDFLKQKPSQINKQNSNQSDNTQPNYQKVFQNNKQSKKFSFLKLRGLFSLKLLELQNYLRIPGNQHRIALSLFTIAATYICYRMQSSFDRMRQKVKYSQSIKKDQIQKQKEYLERMLKKSQFQAVPIGRDYEPKINYKFQEDTISTKDDLMQLIKQDYERGIDPPAQYRQQFFELYPHLRR